MSLSRNVMISSVASKSVRDPVQEQIIFQLMYSSQAKRLTIVRYPNWGSKWKSAHTNLERISFRLWSQKGSVPRTADLRTLFIEEFVSESPYFTLDRISFVCWRLKAHLVSLSNVNTRLSRVLSRFSDFFLKEKYIFIYIDLNLDDNNIIQINMK